MTATAGLDNEREQLGAIIAAYNEVTQRLKDAHERLQYEVRGLRRELSRKNEELRRRERLAALGQMAAGLAHEIRNPIGSIGLHAAMLEDDLADRPAAAGLARRIRGGVRALEGLVGEVLGFAADGQIERRRVDVGEVMERVAERVRAAACVRDTAHRAVAPVRDTAHRAVARGAAQRAEVHETRLIVDAAVGEMIVEGDAARLERAVFNLAVNAVEASRGGRVTLSVRRGGDDGIEIVVADDGAGIAKGDMERIFNPFFTTKANGTGLGLAIVHQIVEAHGGRIRVRSEPGKGAEFVVWLPGMDGATDRLHAAGAIKPASVV